MILLLPICAAESTEAAESVEGTAGARSRRSSTGCGSALCSCSAERTATSLRAEPSSDTSNTTCASMPVFYNYINLVVVGLNNFIPLVQ